MSMTMLESRDSVVADTRGMPSPPVRVGSAAAMWHEVDRGFWVGSTTGHFLGTVESGNTGFVARDHAGVEVGRYSDAVEARTALSSRVSEPRS